MRKITDAAIVVPAKNLDFRQTITKNKFTKIFQIQDNKIIKFPPLLLYIWKFKQSLNKHIHHFNFLTPWSYLNN